jgi:hypothetical protein
VARGSWLSAEEYPAAQKAMRGEASPAEDLRRTILSAFGTYFSTLREIIRNYEDDYPETLHEGLQASASRFRYELDRCIRRIDEFARFLDVIDDLSKELNFQIDRDS